MTRIRAVGLARGTEDRLSFELATAVGVALASLGIASRPVGSSSEIDGLDAIIGVGYPYRYPVLQGPSCPVPRFAWLGEPLPPADETAASRLIRPLKLGRILDGTIAFSSAGGRRPAANLVRWRERVAYDRDRTHNLAAHRDASGNGVNLVVTSNDRAQSLARHGIDALVVPFGYEVGFAGEPTDPGTDRDIDLLVLGTSSTQVPTRRARITAATLAALPASIRPVIVEGGVYGSERHALLRRARVILNVHRAPGNFTGIRTVLAGAAGAVLVSEVVGMPQPFEPGVHYLEAPPDRLAGTVAEVLDDTSRRLAVGRAAQAFLVEDLTMRRSVERIIGTMT